VSRHLPIAALLALVALPVSAQEVDRWGLCPSPPALPELPPADQQVTRLTADDVVADRDGVTTFTGDVVIMRAGKRLEGARVEYQRETDSVDIEGDVRLSSRPFTAEGRTAHLDLAADTGRIDDARYRVPAYHAAGEAERIELLGEGHALLREASYTTCPPEQPTWQLTARKVELNNATNTGEAWDARLELFGAPLLYLPYINFPLAGRKSGFLVPTYGTSEQSGTELTIPYYFNLAPERDATLTTRWLSKRGLMLAGEYRYLSSTGGGQANLSWLPDDQRYGDDRYYIDLEQHARPWRRWSTEVSYREVSDEAWFNDLDDSLATSSLTYLDRRADLRYGGDEWTFLGRVQAPQDLIGVESYARLPQLRIDYTPPARPGQLRFGLGSEVVHFINDDESQVEGSRLDLEPSVSLPLSAAAWFLTPRFALRHTQYWLDQGSDRTPSRTLPVTSVDGGAFFEREFDWLDMPLVQTLEPRAFYLHVPYDDQSDLPVFDTAAYDFTLEQMFRQNRFSGADRVGDANQLTLALTTRILSATSGLEGARASIGQVRYFRDRRVTLPDEPVAENASSAYLAELGLRPLPGLDLATTVRWDPHHEEQELVTAYANYAPSVGKRVGLAYRYREEEIRQTDLLALWPIGQRWRLLGRWVYDLEADQSLETIAGLEYQSCCWALRMVNRGRINSTTGDLDNSLLLTLELKGLSTLGEGPGGELERGILR